MARPYTVELPGGGAITVNANSPEAARENAGVSSGTVVAGGHQAHQEGGTAVMNQGPADYPTTEQAAYQAANPGGTPAAGGDYGAALQQMLDAVKSGNAQAFAEAVRQFDLSFGLDRDKLAQDIRAFNEGLAVTQAGLTGQYQGAPTVPALQAYATQFGQWGVPQTGAQTLAAQAQNAGLYGFNPGLNAQGVPIGANGQPLSTLAAQQQAFAQQQALAEMYGQGYQNFGAVPGGQQTLAAQQQAYAQQLGAVNAAAALQANPFRQQQVIGQLGQVLGGGGVAAFQAPNTVAGVGTAGGNTRGGMGYLQTLIDDIRDPGANTASMNQVLNAIPTPNKINSTEFLRSAPSTQSMVLQGMTEKYGLDPQDALAQIKATLPQFQSPTTMGTIKR